MHKSGWVVGLYRANNASHGFAVQFTTTYPPTQIGSPVLFDMPGGTNTETNGLNNTGQVAGRFWDAAGNSHGFIAALNTTTPSVGSFAQVDCAGSNYTAIHGISDTSANGTGGALIAGSAATSSSPNSGYAFYATAGSGTVQCTQISISGSGQKWVQGIDSAGQYMVGHGGKQGSFLYQAF